MPSLVSEYAAGTLFGAALFAAGVFAPSTIIAQMKLEDFTMVRAMLAASATSAYVAPFSYVVNHKRHIWVVLVGKVWIFQITSGTFEHVELPLRTLLALFLQGRTLT